MFVNSQRFVVLLELPTVALPPVNASCTEIAGDEPAPILARVKRANWNRVSLTSIGPSSAVSVALSVWDLVFWLNAVSAKRNPPVPTLSDSCRVFSYRTVSVWFELMARSNRGVKLVNF